ncbi:uncharacterized protein LOC108116126 [Drosophila eugracilis]|uniref:uncharacterized protein LOC108116126 n=1 Tax=Drosophila eugracilis TaxID=29029 RepID=UPI0007E6BE99|nr:uncharacterized protein LOC108116126 [Drosophila eugracilis]
MDPAKVLSSYPVKGMQFKISPCQVPPGIPYTKKESEGPIPKEETKSKVLPIYSQPKPAKVFHCNHFEDLQEPLTIEESLEGTFEDGLLEFEDIFEEVSRMKRRVSQLNNLLGTNVPECPSIDVCDQEHILLGIPSPIHPDILKLRVSNIKLKNQITLLLPVRKSVHLATKFIWNEYCRNKKLVDELLRGIQELDFYKLQFEKHEGLCLQRFRFLENEKYSGREFYQYIDRRTSWIKTDFKRQIIRSEYNPFKDKAFNVIRVLGRASDCLRNHMLGVISDKKNELFETE